MILVTGSAGHLGEALVRTLRAAGKAVRGMDVVAGPYTDVCGSITDHRTVLEAMQGVSYVLHTATLHKPHVVTHARQQFVDVNISGTLNLLEAAIAQGVAAFVYTSTTSAFGDAMTPGHGAPAVWVDELLQSQPKNIYGVTKTAAEDLCLLFARNHRLPCVVLRTSRFFPEADDSELQREFFEDANLKVLEFLHRRVAIDDVVGAHFCAIEQAKRLGFGKFIISATSPFHRADGGAIRQDLATTIERYCPGTIEAFKQLNWQFPNDIDRVYDNSKARSDLNWQPKYDFAHVLKRVLAGHDWRSELAQAIGKKGYHDIEFDGIPFPV